MRRERRELRVSPSTDNDSYGATQNVERSTKRERDLEEAGTSVVRVQVETMSLALRLRESRWFRSALEQPHTRPEKRLNGAGNGDLGLQGTKKREGSAVAVPNTEMCKSPSKLQNGRCSWSMCSSAQYFVKLFSNVENMSNFCPSE